MFAALSFIFYPFTMQTKGHNYGFAVNYGRAGYVATGRGYTIDPSSVVMMYSNYAASHIYCKCNELPTDVVGRRSVPWRCTPTSHLSRFCVHS